MTEFVDEYPPEKIKGYPFTASPRWSTMITAVASGSERRNQNWRHPLHRFAAPEAVRCLEDLEELRHMWMALAGPLRTFPFRDPLDMASQPVTFPNEEPTVFLTDQVLGIGDGFETEFPLVKRYTWGSQTYDRRIFLPVLASVLIGINAHAPEDAADGGPHVATVTRYGGVVTITPAPEAGDIVTAGFIFDVEVRFEGDDSFDQVVQTVGAGGYADLAFLEVRPCVAGET